MSRKRSHDIGRDTSDKTIGGIDKKSRSTSCYLCQKRKQKCDQRTPSCTNCIKSKTACIQPPRYGELNKSKVKDDYTILLEKKVKQLETILDSKDQSYLSRRYQRIGEFIDSSVLTDQDSTEVTDTPVTTTVTTVTTKSIEQSSSASASTSPPPKETVAALHPTKSLRIKKEFDNNSNRINASDSKNSFNHFESVILTSPPTQFLNQHRELFKKSILTNVNLTQFIQNEPIVNLDPKLAKTFQEMYFRGVQSMFPMFDETEITAFREKFYSKSTIFSGEYNDYHFLCARMFLINAIASLQINNMGRWGPEPLSFFSTALRHLILLSDNLQGLHKIEILFLMVFFLSRADKDTVNIHVLIADSIKTCMELSLHKAKAYTNITPEMKLIKLRVFWCTYLLERPICLAIAKQFILREAKIEVDVPFFPDDKKGMSFINQSIRIRRIESRFIEQLKILNSVSMVSKTQLPQVEKFFQELQNWRNNCQHFQSGVENETLSMFYYSSIRNLVQPYLELLDPENKLFKECQAAAGQFCQTIKSFHHKTSRGYSLLNIHTTFIAGITLIYCLWLQRNRDDMRRKLLGDDKKHTRPTVSEELFTGLDDLRACSVSLYVMAERTKFALSFRDTFEEIMNATIGNLILRCGPDSSEILLPWYSSQMKQKPTFVSADSLKNKSKSQSLPSQQAPYDDLKSHQQYGHLQKNPPTISLSRKNSINPNFSSKFSKPFISAGIHPMPSKLRGMPPATMRRPLHNFELETVDVPRSEEERKEDEDRIRMGRWTRSTIPKGLSHLLSAPVPIYNKESAVEENEEDEEEESSSGETQAHTPSHPSRVLPLPMVSQLVLPQTGARLSSALTNIGSKINEGLPSQSSAQSPIMVKKSSIGSQGHMSPAKNDSIISMSPINPSPLGLNNGVSAPGSVNGWFLDSSLPAVGLPTTTLSGNQPSLSLPIPTPPVMFNSDSKTTIPSYISAPDNKDINTSNSNTSGSTGGNRTSYTHPQIPELFPFVGRTTTMINNISVWTGESGQQIPQTGLQMRDPKDQQGQQNTQPNVYANFQQQPQQQPQSQQQQPLYYQSQFNMGGIGMFGTLPQMNMSVNMTDDQDNILIPSTPYYSDIPPSIMNQNEHPKPSSLISTSELNNINRRENDWGWEGDYGFFP